MLPAQGDLGLPLRRLAGFQGRSDNMVKLRGINVYPTGIGVILREIRQLNGEYFCRVRTDKTGADLMSVVCETATQRSNNIQIKKSM